MYALLATHRDITWACVGIDTGEAVRAFLIVNESFWHFWINHLAGKSEYLFIVRPYK